MPNVSLKSRKVLTLKRTLNSISSNSCLTKESRLTAVLTPPKMRILKVSSRLCKKLGRSLSYPSWMMSRVKVQSELT